MASKKIKVLSALAALGFSVSLLSPYTTVYATENNKNNVQASKRVKGNDRYSTSVEVSKEGWKDGSEYVVIASGEDFADALCAAPLAKKFNAPILLTGKGTVSPAVLGELKRLKAKHVFVVGGDGAVSEEIVSNIKKENSAIKIERLSGNDRYATSVKVAEKLGTDKIVVATGTGYADSLSMASIAAEEGMAILFTQKTYLPQSVKSFIKGKKLGKTFILGGTGVISANVEKEFAKSERLGGSNRYETNQKVLEAFSARIDFKKVYVTVGGPGQRDFADALAASALAAKTFSPIIIMDKTSNVASYTKAIAEENMLPGTEIITIGGEKILPEAKVNFIKILATCFNEDGKIVGAQDKSKPQNIAGNVTIRGNRITIQNTIITNNLYIEADNGVVRDVKVQGTLVIHVGKDGVINLENVQADRIKIVSGSVNGIHVRNVKCNLVEVKSRTKVKAIYEGDTDVKETKACCTSDIEVQPTAKPGKVTVNKTMGDEIVSVRGAIQHIVVECKIKQLILIQNTIVGRIVAKEDLEIKGDTNTEVIQIQAAKGVIVKPADSTTKLPKVDPIDNTTPPTVSPKKDTTNFETKQDNKTERTVNVNLGNLSAYKDKTVESIFNTIKTKNEAEGYKNLFNAFITGFNTLSTEKQAMIKDLNITDSNAKAIKTAAFNKFGIAVNNQTDMDLVKELVAKIQNDKNSSVDSVANTVKTINSLPVPYLTTKDGVKYTASKVSVKFGDKVVYTTGTEKDGLNKAGNINYDELLTKVRAELGTNSLKPMTLGQIAAKTGENITVVSELTDSTGKKTLVVNTNIAFSVK